LYGELKTATEQQRAEKERLGAELAAALQQLEQTKLGGDRDMAALSAGTRGRYPCIGRVFASSCTCIP
jgi:hypothetical protein